MINEREEAWKVIVKVLKKNAFSDKLLTSAGKRIRKDNGNHDLFYRIVKGVVKMQRHLDFLAEQYSDNIKYAKTDIKIRVLLYMGLYQYLYCDFIPAHAAVNETVELGRKLFDEKVSGYINAVMRTMERHPEPSFPEDPIERMSVEYSFPPELIRRWLELWGEDDTEMLCMFFNDVPALNIRVNLLATSTRKFVDYFSRRDVKILNNPVLPEMYTADEPRKVMDDVSFLEGYFSIQDPSAAMVVGILDPQPGESVLDLFAGLGTKTMFIAERMRDTGEITAVDRFPKKIKQLKQSMERLQIRIVNPVVTDAFRFGPVAPSYDRVLLDVPCSGWGVFQKKAELRWQKAQDMQEILKLQENALSYGAKFVRSGGVLVYSTCTMNPRENWEQVQNFLEHEPGFELDRIDGIVDQKFMENGCMRTIPHHHHMDGAFAARLRKKETT